jgi:sphingomyelin phosphodiesterase 2
MIPMSLAHQLLTTHGPAIDTWRVLHPFSSIGAAIDGPEKARGLSIPDALYNLKENGATCDSVLNTWRWTDEQKKRLKRGEAVDIALDTKDPTAKRLDYIFLGGKTEDWTVTNAKVGMVERHPELKVSLSDHFSVEITIERTGNNSSTPLDDDDFLPIEIYDSILNVIDHYMQRERRQRKHRIAHFFFWLSIWISCLVAIWWSPRNYVGFLLMLLSSLGLAAGTVDGLIGFLFMGWEIRTLKEFQWEMENVRQQAQIEIDLKTIKSSPTQ